MDARLTRRAFLAGSTALGLAAPSLGSILAACGRAESPSGSAPGSAGPSSAITPGPAFGGEPPVIDPSPVSAVYGEMLEIGEVAAVALPSLGLRALLDELAADAGIAVADTAVEGRRQARLDVSVGDATLASQAYRLAIAGAADGPTVTIRAGDEAGAWNGLLSFVRLLARDGQGHWVRAATVDDAPGFARRGAILDPWVIDAGGMTRASRATLLERVRLGVRYKLNFVDLPDRAPWPELVEYCGAHHVEVMVGKGYRDWLTVAPRSDVRAALAAQLDAGARSIALCWDDMPTTNPEAIARQQSAVVHDLYDFLRGRDASTQVSAVLPPYGGVPGRNLLSWGPGEGDRYLATIHGTLPSDIRVFWTGDGGVFSSTVTREGAQAYADAVGNELGLWDNDAIYFSSGRRPCSGRSPDLASVVHTYMGNLAGEANWQETNGEFALLTSLMYAWNPAAYEPTAAATTAELILAAPAST
jgi:hypothetical protein